MKKGILTFLLLLPLLNSAQNLVPNSSFEEYDVCPTAPDELSHATGWSSFLRAPDYFNSCASLFSNVNVPDTWAGHQFPADGNAYCGLWTYSSASPNIREAMGCHLISMLQTGQTYFVTLKINCADQGPIGLGTNHMGVKFSTIPYSDSVPIPVNNQANFYSNAIVTDTMNWTIIHGSFVADSPYQYIAIGNFFDDEHTDTIHPGGFATIGFYFIDDVCVSPDSSTCLVSGIENLSEPELTIFPTLASSMITIQLLTPMSSVTLFTTDGKLLKQFSHLHQSKFDLDVEALSSGMYFITASSNNKIYRGKILVVH